MLSRIFVLITFLFLSLFSVAQVGHPAKGSWSGTLLADTGESTRIRLLIDDHDGALLGTVNPGRNSVSMKEIRLNALEWELTVRADMTDGPLNLIGNLSNLGSWTNRKYIGTYTLGKNTGKFEITLN